jgi:hypothetical protein
LISLELWQNAISLTCGVHRAVFPRLRYLDVSNTLVSGDSIAALQLCFPKLNALTVSETGLSHEEATAISAWKNLRLFSSSFPELNFNHFEGGLWR